MDFAIRTTCSLTVVLCKTQWLNRYEFARRSTTSKNSTLDFILQLRQRLVHRELPIYDFIDFRAVTILSFGP